MQFEPVAHLTGFTSLGCGQINAEWRLNWVHAATLLDFWKMCRTLAVGPSPLHTINPTKQMGRK
jgi:hypothetical protein